MTGLLALAFLALNAIDLGLTVHLLKLGGTELNPILSALDNWAAVKLGVAVVAAIACYLLDKTRILLGLVIGMSLAVLWNTMLMLVVA